MNEHAITRAARTAVEPVDGHLTTAQELADLAEALGGYGPMAYFGATLGLRWDEVAGLRVRRLDLLRSELTVAAPCPCRDG